VDPAVKGGHTALIISNLEVDNLKKKKFEFTFNIASDPS